jgi:hypothetical protein
MTTTDQAAPKIGREPCGRASNHDGTFTVANPDVGSFATWASQGPAKLVGDFNGDGRTDIALTGPSQWNTLPVAFSNGDGTFTVTNAVVGEFAWFASQGARTLLGDFNGDGLTDIALSMPSPWKTLAVAFSNGDGTFHATNADIGDFALWSRQQGVTSRAADFNGDGRTDVVLTGAAWWNTLPLDLQWRRHVRGQQFSGRPLRDVGQPGSDQTRRRLQCRRAR